MRTSASCIKDSFYVSIKVDRLLLFTQGSVLGDLIERWNTEMNTGKKNNKKSNQSSLIETDNQKKAIFIIEMYQTSQEDQAQKQKSSTQQSTKLSQTLSLGSIHNVESTSKIYQYPVDITELQLKSAQQLSSMIYHFQPDKRNDLKLVINFKANEKSSIKIGQFQIDLNIYVAMFAEQGISWVRDSKTIVKKLQQDKQISQLTEAVFQVYVERDRLSLERIIRQNKKGINVVDFKEHIRRVMKQKEDLSRVQQDAQENVQIQEEELKMQSVSGKKTKRSLKQKYQQYLARQIESNLYYSNPQSEIIRQQVKSLLDKRAELEKQSNKSSNNSSNRILRQKDNQKIEKHEKQSLTQTNDLKSLLGKDQQRNLIQKLKILGFLIVAGFLLYFAMTPDRKTQVGSIVEEQQAIGQAQL